MFLLAEEISGKNPKRGEVFTSKDTFDVVFAKAETNDCRAMFVAGKYFLANKIAEERDRAIVWIKSAADLGLEEAKRYIDENHELFE
jgi:ribosomal protein L7/L12